MMAGHYEKLALQHAPQITKAIAAFEDAADQLGIQGFGSDLRKQLLEADLAYELESVAVAGVAVWEDNRDEEMLIPARVHVLIAIFCRKGFCSQETLLALAREVLHGSSGDTTRLKNKNLVESTRVHDAFMLAPFKDLMDIKYATAAGSHTYAAVRVIDYVRQGGKVLETEATKEAGLTTDGLLSYQKIVEKCLGIKEVLEKGMPKLFVLRAAFADLVPDCMRILSESDNAKHDNYQHESFMQTMHNVHRRIQNTKPTCEEDYAKIARQVSRSKKAEQALAVSSYTEYVRFYAGEDKKLLLEIEEYIRQLGVVRDVPHEFFKELAKLELWHMALYVVALVKATCSCPKAFAKTGKARVFLPTDLSSISGSNAAKVERAWKMQVEARDLAKALGIESGTQFVKILGAMDVRLAFYVHDKKAEKRQQFASLSAIGVQYYKDLVEAFGAELVHNVKCPWNVVQIAQSTRGAAASSKPALLSVNDRGVVTTDMLNSLGFAVDGHVKNKKKSDDVAMITALGDAGATLWDGTAERTLGFKDLVAAWAPHALEAQVCSSRCRVMPIHASAKRVTQATRSRACAARGKK